jgi:hypothetical protein
MAIFCSTMALAAACTVIRDNVSRICLGDATAAPTATAAEATTVNGITSATMSAAQLVMADSSVAGGKKITVSAQATLTVDATKVGCYIYLISTGATGAIYYRTSCATRAFTSTADRVTIPSFDIHFYDGTVL